jgi:pSer/pThr/pTyr-binding forkhead associated (FHA) protein
MRVDARFASPTPTGRSERADGPSAAAGPQTSADATATAVFTVPIAPIPRAILRVTDPDGRSREVAVEAGGLTIGRAEDNDLVARDSRVSRHHGRIVGRRGTLVYVDLGSTNGSRVNDEPVTEVVLGVGDRLEIGETSLVLEVEAAD